MQVASETYERADQWHILLVTLRSPVESHLILVLLTVKVVDFIPKLRAVHSQLFENVVLFPCRREVEEVAAFHPLLCL